MGKTISELIEKTSASNSDVLLIENGTSTNKITKANFLKEITQDLSSDIGKTEGSYITVENTKDGAITNIEIVGNTVQDSSNLADIKSVGIAREDGNYEIELKSCGRNLCNGVMLGNGYVSTNTGEVLLTTTTNAFYELIPVKGGEDIYVSTQVKVTGGIIAQYDENNNFISATDKQLPRSEKLDSRTRYVRVSINFGKTVTPQISLETGIYVGTNSVNTYEPYQETTSKIILPCQLEKIGTLRDRLYRREDGVWCVEKRISEVNKDSLDRLQSIAFSSARSSTNMYYFTFTINNAITFVQSTYGLICNCLPIRDYNQMYLSTYDEKGIAQTETSGTTNKFQIKIPKTEVISTDSVGLTSWMKENKFRLKYVLANPEIIELPLNTQIELNSFFGETNIFIESGEVDGTIKCTIPKSLGASIQSLNNKTDNLSQRIENVETLKTSQELEVSTDKGYVVCQDTRNGYVEDLKIEGNTLVNLAKCKNLNVVTPSSSYNQYKIGIGTSIKPSTDYTIIYWATKNSTHQPTSTTASPFCVVFGGTPEGDNWSCRYYADSGDVLSYKVDKFRTASNLIIGDDLILISEYNRGSNFNLNLIILEGDYTQNPPSYFEGLKSVGEGVDKIEVLSHTNGNMLDLNNVTKGYYINKLNIKYQDTNSFYCNYLIEISPKMNIYPRNEGNIQVGIYRYYDVNKEFISGEELNTNVKLNIPNNAKYLGISFYDRLSIINSLYVGTGETKLNTPYQNNKKQILFKNSSGVYEKPILRSTGTVSDTIEKHSDGKYYFHKRCGEDVFNGSDDEGWSYDGSATVGRCIKPHKTSKPNASVISDNFKTITVSDFNTGTVEGVVRGTLNINICISKSKLSTQDVAGFKTWLQTNPVTVVYQLATEEVYEVVNLDLDSYDGETSVIFDGGAISPKITFKIASHIANTIQVLKDRINYLEDKVMSMFKAVLAGDVQTLAYELYPEDFPQEDNQQATLEEPPIVDETIEGTELL